MLRYTSLKSPIGPLFLACTETNIIRLTFGDGPGESDTKFFNRFFPATAIERDSQFPLILEGKQQLEEYFEGSRKTFDLPLKFLGTAFQVSVWHYLLTIPYGATQSYGHMAEQLKSSARAVGSANGKNPISIIGPCHRVIASDGSLCGYGGGLAVKRKLLELEGALSAALDKAVGTTLF